MKTTEKEMDFDEMKERGIQFVTYVTAEDAYGINYSTLVCTENKEALGGALLSFFDTICNNEEGERLFMNAVDLFKNNRKLFESFRKGEDNENDEDNGSN